MLLHNHLDIIGRNEPIQRKAKFWQSYVRALKGPPHLAVNERTNLFALSKYHSIGTDDIRAPEGTHYSPSRGVFRSLLNDFPTWPGIKSMYDDPVHAADRITVPGYRYMPISRETYGISPRNIYPHHYTSLDRYPRYGENDFTSRIRGEFKHKNRDYFEFSDAKTYSDWDPETGRLAARARTPFCREYSPGPDGNKIPISHKRGGYQRPALSNLIEPSPWIPITRFTRDPWWYSYPQYRPFAAPYIPSSHSPFYLRDSYLSPVKRTFLWKQHPIRPFTTTPRLDF